MESSQRALQDYTEKHHSPTIYCKTKWGKFESSSSQTEKPFLLQLKSERSKTNFVGKRTTRAYPTKTENIKTSKRDCAKGWKGETFQTGEPAKSPIPKMQ